MGMFRRGRLYPVSVPGVVVAFGISLIAVASLAAQARASGASTVPQGINAGSIPGAQPFGDTPADTPEQVSFIMRERNLPELEGQAQQGFSRFLALRA